MSEIADSAVLIGRDLDGRTMTREVKGDQLVDLPGSALITQRVRRMDDGTMLIRRSLRLGADDPALLLLDNEIRALARLTRAFPAEQTRPFPTLVGYDMDSRDPWALVSDYRGRPAGDAVSDLLPDGLMKFAARLFDALTRMALVEVVHNRLNLAGMYLAGPAPSIVTFEHALLAGEPRDDLSGVARPQDDVLDAGRLLYQVFTGSPTRLERPYLSEVPALRSRLEDLFAEPGDQPSARDVLLRFDNSLDIPVLETHDGLSAGRAAFDAARRKKNAVEADPPGPGAPRPAKRKPLRPRGGLALLISMMVGGLR